MAEATWSVPTAQCNKESIGVLVTGPETPTSVLPHKRCRP